MKGVLAVVDATALVPRGTGTAIVKTVRTVSGFTAKFSAELAQPHPKAGALLASGVVVHPMPDSGHVDGKELLFGTGNWVQGSGPVRRRLRGEVVGLDRPRRPRGHAGQRAREHHGSHRRREEAAVRLLVARLIAAKKRGVDVQVLLGYQPSFGAPSKTATSLKTLQAAGIRASFLKSHYLHGKAIVADDRAYVGSQNFTNGGLRTNRELGEILGDAAAVKLLASTFAADMSHPD